MLVAAVERIDVEEYAPYEAGAVASVDQYSIGVLAVDEARLIEGAPRRAASSC